MGLDLNDILQVSVIPLSFQVLGIYTPYSSVCNCDMRVDSLGTVPDSRVSPVESLRKYKPLSFLSCNYSTLLYSFCALSLAFSHMIEGRHAV
jgi:hypothetical protein